jgi:hypothetical protein
MNFVNKLSNKIIKTVLIIGLSIICTIIVHAYETGVSGRTSTTTAGCSCHGSRNTATTLSLSSSNGSFSIPAGSTATFTITINNTDKAKGGIDIAVKSDQTGTASVGTLLAIDSDLQLRNGDLVQTSAKPMKGGAVSFTFKWIAPLDTGTYYLRTAGLASDNDGTESEDEWNWMTLQTLIVKAASPVSLTSPVGGENLCQGSVHNIIWSTQNVSNINIELSSDNGVTFGTTIASSTPATAGSYSWYIPTGQTAGSSYVIRISDPSDSTINSTGSSFSILSLPKITIQPVEQTVMAGDNATFSLEANGSGNTYQWRFNSENIFGETSSSLNLTSISSVNAGNYDAVVTNSCWSVISNSVALTVNSGSALLTLSKSKVDFGNVKINTKKDITIYNIFKNNGNENLEISNIYITGLDKSQFSIVGNDDFPITIKPKKRKSIAIRFRPTSTGMKTAMIEFESNSSSNSTISLTGTGTSKDNDDVSNGDSLKTGSTHIEQKIVIYNSWDQEENVTLNIIGFDADKFTLVSPDKNFIIAPNQEKEVKIIANNSNSSFFEANLIEIFKYTSEIINIDIQGPKNAPTTVKDNYDGRVNCISVYPNPSSDNIMISYYLTKLSNPFIEIVDIFGNQLKNFNIEKDPEGTHLINWDGIDKQNRLIPNGYYIVIFRNNNKIDSYPLVINR